MQNPAVRLPLATRVQDETALLACGTAVPFLVVQGTADRHVQHDKLGSLMEKHFSGVYTFHRLEGVGHACFYEKPDEVGRSIVEFVQRTR